MQGIFARVTKVGSGAVAARMRTRNAKAQRLKSCGSGEPAARHKDFPWRPYEGKRANASTIEPRKSASGG